MPVLGEIVAAPLVAGAVAVGVAYWETNMQADPCRPPAIRIESANIAALPGPHSLACKEAREKAARQKNIGQTETARKVDAAQTEKQP